MTSITALATLAKTYGYNPPSSKPVVLPVAIDSTLATIGKQVSAPVTYNASGLLNAPTSIQTAKAAVIAAKDIVTQTMGALALGTTANSTDIFASNDANSVFGLSSTTPSNNTAQNALFAAENTITQAQASLA